MMTRKNPLSQACTSYQSTTRRPTRAAGKMPVQLERKFTTPSTVARATSTRSNPSYGQAQQHHAQEKSEPRVTRPSPLSVPLTSPRPTQRENRRGISSSMMREASSPIRVERQDGDAEVPVADIAVHRAVRFDSVLKLILVPSRRDLKGLRSELWYREEDYLEFRIGALTDTKNGSWRGIRRRRRAMLCHPPVLDYVKS